MISVLSTSDVVNRVGSVSDIQVLTNGGAFVAVWSSKTSTTNGCEAASSHLPATLAVFTPFGTQTWCSLESILDRFIALKLLSYISVLHCLLYLILYQPTFRLSSGLNSWWKQSTRAECLILLNRNLWILGECDVIIGKHLYCAHSMM